MDGLDSQTRDRGLVLVVVLGLLGGTSAARKET